MSKQQDEPSLNVIEQHNGHAQMNEFERFFELSLDLLCVIGVDGYLKRVNPVFEQTLGWSVDELLSRPFFDFIHPDDIFAAQSYLKKFNQSVETIHFECQFRCQDGSYKWLAWKVQSTLDQTAYAVVRDITANRQTKAALKGSEQRFRRFVSSLGDHIYVTEFTSHGKQINQYISPNVEKLTGYSTEKLLNDWQFWGRSMIHPDDRDKATHQVARFAEGQDSEVEYRLIRADGQIIWVRDSGRVEVDPQSGSLVVYGVVSDINSRKLAEERLKQREERTNLLNKLMAQAANNLDEQLKEALTLTVKLLDVEIGIVSQIDNDLYTIRHFYAPGVNLEKGQMFELGNTYCSITLQTGGVMAIDHMQTSQYRQHPCYPLFNLEAYVGVPITVHGKTYGTINFSSSKPKHFSAADKDYLELLARWVGAMLERSQAEEDLRENEARLSEAQHMAKLGTWIWNTQNDRMVWSDQLYEILGIPRSVEGSYQLYEELIHPEDREHVRRAIDSSLKSDRISYEFEHRLIRQDGEMRYIAGISRIQREANQSVRMIGVAQDVTERKLAEETIKKQNVELTLREDKLRQNVEKLQATQTEMARIYAELKQQSDQINLVQQVARIGTWEVDVETHVMKWNAMMFEIFRIPKSDQPPALHELTELVHSDDRDLYLENLQLLMRQGIRVDQELKIQRNDEIIDVYVAGLAQYNTHKKVTKIFGLFQDITRRKHVEGVLRDSQEKLSQALNIAKLSYWELDLQTFMLFLNDQFYHIFGTNAEREGGYRMSAAQFMEKFIHPNDISLVNGELEKLAAVNDPTYFHEIEYRFIKPSGEEGIVLGNFRTEQENGKSSKVIGTIQDITDRKRAEVALRQAAQENSRLVTAINSAAIGVTISDTTQPDNPLIFVNPAFTSLTGYRADDVLGKNCRFLQGQDTDTNEVDKIRHAINGERSITVELLNYRKDGTPFWNELSINPIFDDQGNLTNFVGVQADVTLRKQADLEREKLLAETQMLYKERSQAEQTLRENEERLSEALETAKLGYWEFDVASQNFTFNDPFYSIFRTTAEKENGYIMPVGDYIQKFFLPEDASVVGEEVQKALATDDPNYVGYLEHRMIRADKELGYLSVQFRIEKDSFGQTIKIIGINQDITERKEAELERERLLKEVEEAYRYYVRGEWEKFLGDQSQNRLQVEHHQIESEPSQASKKALAEIQTWVAQEGKAKVLLAENQNGHSTDPAIVAPISLRGETIGTLSLQDIDANRRWTAEEIALVETVSEQLALTIENLRLFDDTQRRASREQLTRKIADKMRAAPDIETIIETGLMELADVLKVPRTYVKLVADTSLKDTSAQDVSDNANSE
ncbi:MAG: PAS domain-containing protein [Anaerolineae bacterium]|nr:PAS domain-containing protein [Anaerolineae bacterium]